MYNIKLPTKSGYNGKLRVLKSPTTNRLRSIYNLCLYFNILYYIGYVQWLEMETVINNHDCENMIVGTNLDLNNNKLIK